MKEQGSSFLITYEDLLRIAKKHRKTLLKLTLAAAIFGFFYSVTRPLKFKAEASFREAAAHMPQHALSQFLSGAFAGGQEGSASFIIQSETILRDVTGELGLQAQVKGFPSHGRLNNIIDRARLSLFGKFPEEGFEFTKLSYVGEEEQALTLCFEDEKHFSLSKKDGGEVIRGDVGKELALEDLTLTLNRIPASIKVGKEYQLAIKPWREVVKPLRGSLEIRADKKDPQILWLYYAHRSRRQAAKITNQLVKSFLKYLKEEDNKVATSQLAFLKERRENLEADFGNALDKHVECLSESVSSSGFLEVKQQITLLEKPQQDLQQRLIELYSLEGTLKDVQATYARFMGLPLRPELGLTAASTEEFAFSQLDGKSRFWPQQFAGIDLKTAEALHAEYQRNLDQIENQIDRVEFLLPRMRQDGFELNALSSLAHDEVTAAMARKASELALSLREESNYSQKDIYRLGESLKSQKKFIEAHLSQSLELYRKQARIIQNKLAALRAVMLKLIGSEKEIIHEQMGAFQHRLNDVPARWRVEKQIEMQSSMLQKIAEGMAQVVEGKIIEHHLKNINSKMIDPAYPPKDVFGASPKKIVVLSALLTLAFGYFFFVCRTIWQGMPLSLSAADAYGLSTCGRLSLFRGAAFEELPKRDLETLRKSVAFIEKQVKPLGGTSVAVVGNDQRGIGRNLASLLAWQKQSVLMVDLSFSQRIPSNVEQGLWHYLQGKTDEWIPVQREGYDLMLSGATTRFATELMRYERFERFLDQARDRYERILLISETPIDASETQLLLQKADLGIIIVDQESHELLARTGITAIVKQNSRATLVFREE